MTSQIVHNNDQLVGIQAIGIGTNNPQSQLHVVGTVTASGFSGPGAGLTGTALSLAAGSAIVAATASTALSLTGTPDITVGTITGTTYYGDGGTLSNLISFVGATGPVGPQGPVGLGFEGLLSTSSVAIATGTLSFTTNLGTSQTAFTVNEWVVVTSTVTPTSYMIGRITSFTGTTLTIDVSITSGTGTYASWKFALVGASSQSDWAQASSTAADFIKNKPTIPAAQVSSDWNAVSGVAQILNKPTIPAAQVSSDWNAASGVSQILNKPTIPAAQVNSNWNAVSGVAQILNKPTIPAAQVNSDWNASSGVAQILNKPSIPVRWTGNIGNAATNYFIKVATLKPVSDTGFPTAMGIRGKIGQWNGASGIIDCFIQVRDNYAVFGSYLGNITDIDFKVYRENDLTFSLYLYFPQYSYVVWDFELVGGTSNDGVTLLTPTTTNTTTGPTGNPQTTSLLAACSLNIKNGGQVVVQSSEATHSAVITNKNNSGFGLIVNAAYDPLRVGSFNENSGNLLIVKGDGNVGIGTGNPQTRLHVFKDGVNGNIGGEIRVCAGLEGIARVGCYEGELGDTWGCWFQYNGYQAGNGANIDLIQIGGKRSGLDTSYVNIDDSNGNVGIGVIPNTSFKLYVSGAIGSSGDITALYSDERLKTKTGGLSDALTKVCSLDTFTYVNNDLAKSLGFTDELQRVGVSAQQVQKVLPEAVRPAPFDADNKSGQNYLTVQYEKLVPLLIEALKEERQKREAIEERLTRLEKLLLKE